MQTTSVHDKKRRNRRTQEFRRRQPSSQKRGVESETSQQKQPIIARVTRGPLTLSLTSGLLLFAAFPPVGLGFLAFVAPVGWLLLIRKKNWTNQRLYACVYLASAMHWLLLLHGIRLAHWAAWLGWFALAMYVAAYLPLFVVLSRIAVHRLRWPIAFAAPVIWTGLELARGYMLTGFSMGLLGHTQANWLELIQIADLGGAYAVSFVVMCVAACVSSWIPFPSETPNTEPVKNAIGFFRRFVMGFCMILLMLGGAVGYGWYRLGAHEDSSRFAGRDIPRLKAALIQGSFDTVFGAPPGRDEQIFERYLQLTEQARKRHPDVNAVVWPECVFSGPFPDVMIDDDFQMPTDAPPGNRANRSEILRGLQRWRRFAEAKNRAAARRIHQAGVQEADSHRNETRRNDLALVFGSNSYAYTPRGEQIYNSVLLMDSNGVIHERYHKTHRVMFGEYVPLGEWLPWLYRLTPMSRGLTPGDGPRCLQVSGWRASPSVCFESTVPQLIRSQVAELRQQGKPPDLLINVTNDGWFKGSSVLDLHLVCSVFRAVENRLPMLIAANTGFSAWIDGSGRLLAKGPRYDEAYLIADVQRDGRSSVYQKFGDIFSGACLLLCAVVAGVGTGRWFSKTSH